MTLILLHGWGQNKDVWGKIESKFSDFNVTSIDLPGFGNEKLESVWGIPEYADWMEDYVVKKKLKKVVIIGHSFGGRIAAETASKNPEWLVGLVLSGAPCIYRPELKVRMKIWIYKMLKNLIPKNFHVFFVSEDLKDAKKGGLEQVFRKVVNYDQTKRLKKIEAPTLLIWGEDDKDVPIRVAREMADLIETSELKVIHGAGHNSYLDNSNIFYGYAKNFINNLSAI